MTRRGIGRVRVGFGSEYFCPGGPVQWLNEPAQWSEQAGALVVTADAGTDFWRITGYGFIRESNCQYLWIKIF
jgi:hypothetical protein